MQQIREYRSNIENISRDFRETFIRVSHNVPTNVALVFIFIRTTVARHSREFSLADKNVHFDPFLPPMTAKTRGDSDVPQNSQIFLFPEVNVPQFLNNVVKMSLRCCQ